MRGWIIAAVLLSASTALADASQVGLWFGPRVFSGDSKLGFIPDAPAHPTLDNSIEFGIRGARPFFPWLIPELELALSPTKTNAVGGAASAGVFWLEPRLHLRLELLPGRRVMPFLVVGGGSPISLSSAQKTFDTSIVGEGYVGGGVRLDTGKGFVIRVDGRIGFSPGNSNRVTVEADFGFGLEVALGKKPRPIVHEIAITAQDQDGDGVPNGEDKCPDRPEDQDGFEDRDGCPDIDNDLDGVLDIADKCANVNETYNGFEDDDGCPDTIPPDVDSLRGTVEGLLYAEGETVVKDAATPNLTKIAKIMQAHPSIRVVLIGHADSKEAAQFATEPTADLTALAADLSRARAEAVRQALSQLGIPAGRIELDAKGAEEPVSDNDTARGRSANRRVEIRLYVPVRTKK
ncbi:MAG: OmpA family protein [Proteobacteria bacterium]|nr:OmpA family protein [Pseudomonadota bacterium]